MDHQNQPYDRPDSSENPVQTPFALALLLNAYWHMQATTPEILAKKETQAMESAGLIERSSIGFVLTVRGNKWVYDLCAVRPPLDGVPPEPSEEEKRAALIANGWKPSDHGDGFWRHPSFPVDVWRTLQEAVDQQAEWDAELIPPAPEKPRPLTAEAVREKSLAASERGESAAMGAFWDLCQEKVRLAAEKGFMIARAFLDPQAESAEDIARSTIRRLKLLGFRAELQQAWRNSNPGPAERAACVVIYW